MWFGDLKPWLLLADTVVMGLKPLVSHCLPCTTMSVVISIKGFVLPGGFPTRKGPKKSFPFSQGLAGGACPTYSTTGRQFACFLGRWLRSSEVRGGKLQEQPNRFVLDAGNQEETNHFRGPARCVLCDKLFRSCEGKPTQFWRSRDFDF